MILLEHLTAAEATSFTVCVVAVIILMGWIVYCGTKYKK